MATRFQVAIVLQIKELPEYLYQKEAFFILEVLIYDSHVSGFSLPP
jgi:hypothetical protein